MEKEGRSVELSLTSLWSVFCRRWWILLLVFILSFVALFGLAYIRFVPKYESTAVLYILRQREENEVQQNADFQVSLLVAADCTYILKSHTVLEQVKSELKLDTTIQQLSSSVTTTNRLDTRILEVTVVADTPENAKAIVDSVCKNGEEEITRAMGYRQVMLYEYGVLKTEPCNAPSIWMSGLVSLLLAVLLYTIFVIIFVCQDRVGSIEDIERRLGVTVLAEIPDADSISKKHHRYYRNYTYLTEGNKDNKRSGTKS